MNKKKKSVNILLGVTGSIAAFKALALASIWMQQHASVRTILTKNAARFVTPLSFQTITRNRVYSDMFDEYTSDSACHISIADWADMFIIAPASANIIAKCASGLCDDLVSITALTFDGIKVIAPAMESRMYKSETTKENLERLEKRGFYVVGPEKGRLASGALGIGRMVEPDKIYRFCVNLLNKH